MALNIVMFLEVGMQREETGVPDEQNRMSVTSEPGKISSSTTIIIFSLMYINTDLFGLISFFFTLN